MVLSKILVLCDDSARFARVRGACGALGRGLLRGVTHSDDALHILRDGTVRLVIIDRAMTLDLDAVASLLHAASTARRPFKIAVLTENYEEFEATMLFQLGVSEYLDYYEHQDALATTIAALAGLPKPSTMELELASKAYPAPRRKRVAATA